VGSNNRLYNNRIFDFNSGISVAPASVGPTYIFRNVFGPAPSIGPEGRLPIKLNVNHPLSTDWVYIYHNTSWTDSLEHDGFTFWQYSKWTNVIMRNNIFIGTEFALRNNADPNPVDMNYDNIYTTKESRGFRWLNVDYFSVTNFTTATGLEPNGLSTNAAFIDSASADFYLATNSPMIDRALPIPGINDGFIGEAPDIGAFEHGAVAFSVSNMNDNICSEWNVGPFTYWSLEYSPSLDSPAWTSVSDVVESRGWQIAFDHATNTSPGFYRVVRVPESAVTNALGASLQ
jgi:hypothetical protein